MTPDPKNHGGPAFPADAAKVHPADVHALREHMGWSAHDAMRVLGRHPGMTLRDWFAGQALPGVIAICSADTLRDGETSPQMFARKSYAVADAMLAERGP